MFNLYAENGKKNKIYFTEREIKKTNTHAAFEAFYFWCSFNFIQCNWMKTEAMAKGRWSTMLRKKIRNEKGTLTKLNRSVQPRRY